MKNTEYKLNIQLIKRKKHTNYRNINISVYFPSMYVTLGKLRKQDRKSRSKFEELQVYFPEISLSVLLQNVQIIQTDIHFIKNGDNSKKSSLSFQVRMNIHSLL